MRTQLKHQSVQTFEVYKLMCFPLKFAVKNGRGNLFGMYIIHSGTSSFQESQPRSMSPPLTTTLVFLNFYITTLKASDQDGSIISNKLI